MTLLHLRRFGMQSVLALVMVVGLVADSLAIELVPYQASGSIDWHAAVIGSAPENTDGTRASFIESCPGCCSSHGGITSSCASSGRVICHDGTVSPSCSCSSCGVIQTPTCTGGQVYSNGACRCPGTQVLINGQCSNPPTCTGGQVYTNGACQCPGSQVLINGQCSAPPTCTGGQVYTNGACQCPASQVLINGQCALPPTCTGGQTYTNGACRCSGTQVLVNGQCTTLPVCTGGHVLSGATCVCSSGQTDVDGVCVALSTFAIGPGMSGNWYNPEQSGHGIQVEVLKDPPGYLSAFWFVFDNSGNQVWIAGAGLIQGNKVVVDSARRVGARFPPNFSSSDASPVPWGTMTITFTDCTHGSLQWASIDPVFQSAGTLDLVRLTQVAGTTCP